MILHILFDLAIETWKWAITLASRQWKHQQYFQSRITSMQQRLIIFLFLQFIIMANNLTETKMKEQFEYFGPLYFTLLRQLKRTYPHLYIKLVQWTLSKASSHLTLQQSLRGANAQEKRQIYLLLFHLSYYPPTFIEAIEYFLRFESLSQDNNSQLNYRGLGTIQLQNGQIYQMLRDNKINNWKAYVLLGQLLTDCSLIQEAIIAFDHALKLNEACGQACIGLAIIYGFQNKQLEEARRYIEMAGRTPMDSISELDSLNSFN